jgi:asparagine synthase (glutamine-hydrolysing)
VGGYGTGWREEFEGALDRICAPGEPVGLMLSAGLDSSSIALGLRRLGRPVEVLNFTAPDVPDESSLAEALARHLQIPSMKRLSISHSELGTLLDEIVPGMEEPQCHPSLLTSHVMCRAAADHFPVLLTGDGAEETLGGYPWYAKEESADTDRQRHLPLLRRLRRARRRAAKSTTHVPSSGGILNRHIQCMRPAMLQPQEIMELLAPSGAVHFSETEMLAPLLVWDEPALPQRRRMLRLDVMTFCAEAVLPKLQQASTAHGLDIRLPFLDHRLVEWALAQPVDDRERDLRKPVLRDYLRGHVPDAIVSLPKHGLRLPWTRRLPVEKTLRELRDSYWVRQGYWAPDVEKYVRVGDEAWRGRLWNLHLLDRWAAYWLH